MDYQVYIAGEGLAVTCAGRTVLENLTIRLNFMRKSNVRYIPDVIERGEDGDTLVRFIRSPKAVRLDESKHVALRLRPCGDALTLHLELTCDRYALVPASSAFIDFNFPARIDGLLTLNTVNPYWFNVEFEKSLDRLEGPIASAAAQYGGLHVHYSAVYTHDAVSELCETGLCVSTRAYGVGALAAPVLSLAAADQPYAALDRNFAAMREIGIIRTPLRADRPYPRQLEGFGWCSWNAFYTGVSAEKILAKMEELREKDLHPRWVLIDDGWSDTNGFLLSSFSAHPTKFPDGLAPLIRTLKEDYGVEYVGVWCAYNGYWQGIDPDGPLAQSHADCFFRPAAGKVLMPGPGEDQIFAFWDAWFSELAAQGVDFVKVDNQGATVSRYDLHYTGCGGCEASHNGLERAVNAHFDGAIINCMGATLEDAVCRPGSAVCRTSYDFRPHHDLPFHTMQSAYCATAHSQIHICDYDMFFSTHPEAVGSAVLRTISGGPVYVSDQLGGSNPEVIDRICDKQGRLFRFDHAAVPTLDCYYTDCAAAEVPLKVFNTAGENIVVAAFGITQDKTVEGRLTLGDLPAHADRYLVHDGLCDRWHLLADPKDKIKFSLGYCDCALWTLYPIAEDDTVAIGDKRFYAEGAGPAVLRCPYTELLG